jgi:hypothetical protein
VGLGSPRWRPPVLSRHGLKQLIEPGLSAVIGADWHECSVERLGQRNGYRPRTLPTILAAGRRVDQAQ